MNNERKLTLIFLVLGLAAGVTSLYLENIQALGLATGVYLISFFLVRQLLNLKEKLSWILTTTAVTFALVWLISWILLFSLR